MTIKEVNWLVNIQEQNRRHLWDPSISQFRERTLSDDIYALQIIKEVYESYS